ncbi:hypothetical protein WN48_03583 [Eufriesea mexicana]|nr:hypothetical protein WN48_03583 [Eufriesea mexicana]
MQFHGSVIDDPVFRQRKPPPRCISHFGRSSQALALTHKASPPSRPSSVSSLPRSPQSHQSQQSQPQNTTQLPPVHPHQSQTPLSAPQTPFSAHNQHPKQEANTSPKQEGFDLSKSTSSTDDGPYKRVAQRTWAGVDQGRRCKGAGGLWQSTQGLEAKRLIPQEALHPVLIRREFYERFERYPLYLSPTCRERPPKFEKFVLASLYHDARPITYEKYKDMEQLLPYIPPVHHEQFKTMPREEHK